MTNCITSLPSAFSTATEMVSRWTSRPTYLMLFIGCSFRQAWLTASHSSHSLLRKGRPFIMRAPFKPLLLERGFFCTPKGFERARLNLKSEVEPCDSSFLGTWERR